MPQRIEFMNQAAATENQPERMMDALDKLVQDVVGARLFTLMRFDLQKGLARRIYSNMPDAYPVSGTKPLTPSAWSEQVLTRQESFVANSFDEVAAVFDDAEQIRALGCESCLNIPVVVKGTLLGTLNCLHEAGYYTPERIEAADALKLPGAIALMASFELDARDAESDERSGPI